MKKLKVIFMGTPSFAVPVLKYLIQDTSVIGVVTQPDKERGRRKVKTFSPIKELAIDNNIKVYQPYNIKEEYEEILNLNPDIIITCAYGQFIPKEVIENPKFGTVNVHASLLPKLRGGAPIHHAIINGETETGITIMRTIMKMDKGPIYAAKKIKIEANDTYDTLAEKLSILGGEFLKETLPKIINKELKEIVQEEDKATFGMNIKKEEEKLNFSDSTKNVYNKIRGLSSVPGAYAILDGKRMKIYKAEIGENKGLANEIIKIYKDGIGVATLDGEIILKEIQLEGKKRMDVKSFLNGIDTKTLVGKSFE